MEKLLEPKASSIIQSLRDIGYNLNTAVADIIDNSIAAQASKIEIRFTSSENPELIIADNGIGMSKDELYEAMRFAYIGPNEVRKESDLGRFGLGLKTATFSQARRLIVLTSKNKEINCVEWNLDHVINQGKWLLQIREPKDINLDDDLVKLVEPHGTIVIWREVDRVFDKNNNPKYLNDTLNNLRDHIALVFHRFLSGLQGDKLEISLNCNKINPVDPFLLKNHNTQNHPVEKVKVGDSAVTIHTHILPHHKWLKKDEEEYLKNKSDLLNNQGFYVYRNGRLMVWGDWFRLIKKSESTKLARIEIHFDNTLDAEWQIDVKKSKVSPPSAVRQRLIEIIERIAGASKRIYGARTARSLSQINRPWERLVNDGYITYAINRNYPIIQEFEKTLNTSQKSQWSLILDVFSRALPVESIYADMSSAPKAITSTSENSVDLISLHNKFLQIADIFAIDSDEKKLLEACKQTGLFLGFENQLIKWVHEYVK
ncbi:hypothetical protein B0681_02260 [Moraxella porci DSM 25326]|uniref:ATP-binding protein n=1 Tax=Moraxella porci DSM 25326 TaxID=573983 RepID=A0A1T0CWV0_9GAMM|nr:ATP-binding protein [Moraxella porci]OOS26709.1 hypothetical protein B0681_02260 [Moraxella porci DSM 25326]